MGREVVHCRLWTFHFCGLFVDPELLSQTGSRQRGAGRTQKFPILPSLSLPLLSSLLPFSQEPCPAVARASSAAGSQAFCTELKCWWFPGPALYLAGTRGTVADELWTGCDIVTMVWSWEETREDVITRWELSAPLGWLLTRRDPSCGKLRPVWISQCRDRNVSLIIWTRAGSKHQRAESESPGPWEPSSEHSTQPTSLQRLISSSPGPVTSQQLPFPIYNFHPQQPVTLALRVSVTSCYMLHYSCSSGRAKPEPL